MTRFGPAGWSYDDWAGIVYPSPKPARFDPLRYLAGYFDPVGYVRVHGRNNRDRFRREAGRDARYDYLYTARELEPWVERIHTLEEGPTEDLYVVTNNHYRGKAAANALMLSAMTGGVAVAAPPQLVEAYPQELGAMTHAAAPREDRSPRGGA
jgi:uncharacterized protein YecE (DUF72 family)